VNLREVRFAEVVRESTLPETDYRLVHLGGNLSPDLVILSAAKNLGYAV
jgi:hypothetical protein